MPVKGRRTEKIEHSKLGIEKRLRSKTGLFKGINNKEYFMSDLGDKFLILYKQLYFEKITPSGELRNGNTKYLELSKLKEQYFANNLYYEYFLNRRHRELADFFLDEKYFIALWAAHFLIENGNSPQDLTLTALNIIKTYAESTFNPQVSAEERHWLEEHNKKTSAH